jgi:exonuclease SbcC
MLNRMELELRSLRADWVEASGDLEAMMLEWVRERQDADSHLQGYRDRARELRARIRVLETVGESSPCPTCGEPIGEHVPRLMETLRDEWEAVVQDGRWWKRRREQLDPKPIDLRQMEEKVLRHLVAVEELGERLEREKERLLHTQEGTARADREVHRDGEIELPPLESLVGVRDILREVGNLLHRWTEGRIMGMSARDSELRLLGVSGEERHPEGAELAALGVALRLTLDARLPARLERKALLFWELHESGGAETAVSLLEFIAASPMSERLIFAVVPPSVLGGSSECYDIALEFRSDERGRIRSRKISGGVPKLRAR